jgi:uncharacterized membrane protein (UPF0127 family)
MQNPCSQFQRAWMMPTPFVLTDVVIKQKIKPTSVVQTAEPISTGSATQNTTVVAKPINSTRKRNSNNCE